MTNSAGFQNKLHQIKLQCHKLLAGDENHRIKKGIPSDDLSSVLTAEKEPQVIQKAISYIQKNYNNNITMSTIANHTGLSYNHFSKLFKDKVGENFIDYITRLRIDKAKDLLTNPEKDIRIICQTVGYTSPRHFSKIFYQYTGLLPSQYRKQLGITGLIDIDAE